MAATHNLPQDDGAERLVDAVDQLRERVRAQAAVDQGDRRRAGLLHSLSMLLEQPRRAAALLADHDAQQRQV